MWPSHYSQTHIITSHKSAFDVSKYDSSSLFLFLEAKLSIIFVDIFERISMSPLRDDMLQPTNRDVILSRLNNL